jgi:sugar/nucleoside kinase (ribokinase family)
MKKVLGIGNALVDILIRIDNDEFLVNNKLPKGSMQLVDLAQSSALLKATTNIPKQIASGGSSGNTMNGLGCLGIEAGYIGTVGNDEFGKLFAADMQKSSVKPYLLQSKTDTGRAVTFITADGERTFATYLGAAVEINAADLKEEMFKGYDILYLEGYLVFNHALVDRAVEIAKKLNMEVALDLASFNVVDANKDYLRALAKNYVDILFANEEESKSFSGLSPHEAVNDIAELCKIAVVKLGAQGSLVKTGGVLTTVAPIKANCIDTTGAGDLFAAGFLYAYSKGMSMENCGKAASILGSKVVETIGAKISDENWEIIKNQLPR